MAGLFVTFEGGDGSGKSTQSAVLVQWLEGLGQTVMVSREPGGTELGEELREIVLHRRGEISPRAEALIYAADRAHNVATRVRPALARGEIVVQDRYLDSSVAYQGSARALGVDDVRRVSLWAAENLLPDLTILLDLDEAAGRERLNSSGRRYDRLESEQNSFHANVRAAYLELAAAEPQRFLVLDAREPVAELAGSIRARVQPLLNRARVQPLSS